MNDILSALLFLLVRSKSQIPPTLKVTELWRWLIGITLGCICHINARLSYFIRIGLLLCRKWIKQPHLTLYTISNYFKIICTNILIKSFIVIIFNDSSLNSTTQHILCSFFKSGFVDNLAKSCSDHLKVSWSFESIKKKNREVY